VFNRKYRDYLKVIYDVYYIAQNNRNFLYHLHMIEPSCGSWMVQERNAAL